MVYKVQESAGYGKIVFVEASDPEEAIEIAEKRFSGEFKVALIMEE